MAILKILEVLLGFGFMIFIHEGGHYLACRFFKVDVEEFALGFGPLLASRRIGRTLYTLRAVPLGGFCKPKGGDLSGASAEEMYASTPAEGEFLFASWWKRVLIFLAGPSMNFISAFVIVLGLFLFLGEPVDEAKTTLGYVPPGSLAAGLGLKPGDRVTALDGAPVKTFQEFIEKFPAQGQAALLTLERAGKSFAVTLKRPAAAPGQEGPDPGFFDTTPAFVGEAVVSQPARNAGVRDGDEIVGINGKKPMDWAETVYLIRNSKQDPLQLSIRRDGKTYDLSIHRIFNGQFKAIGISMPVVEKDISYKKVGLVVAAKDSMDFVLIRTGALLSGLKDLAIGRVSLKDSVSGPITIMRLMYQRAAQKVEELLVLISTISLMLFLMNLLPIPVVDGGQIVLCLIEGLKRGPVSVKAQMIYQQVGFFMIIGLMGLAVFNDLKSLFLEFHNHLH